MNQAQSIETSLDKARRDLLSAGRSLWLAGLGAVAEVEKGGRGLFDRLVERGRPMEDRQRKAMEGLGDRTGETVREMRKLLQESVEYEGKGVLKKLGVLTRDDLKLLAARIDTLALKIEELAAQRQIAATSAFPVKATQEPAAVKAAAKTPVKTPVKTPAGRRPRPQKHEIAR